MPNNNYLTPDLASIDLSSPPLPHDPRSGDHRVSEHNSEALRQLIEEHTPRLWQKAFDLCGDADQADDLVQATWVQAHFKHTSFQGKGSFAAWIGTILRNTYINQRRDQRRREQHELDSFQDPSLRAHELPVQATVESLADTDESIGRLVRAVLTLSPREREVFVLRAIVGQSVREVAQRIDRAEGTVKATFSHAVARLRARLEEPELQNGLPNELGDQAEQDVDGERFI